MAGPSFPSVCVRERWQHTGEIDGKDDYTFMWTVHAANKKSTWVRFRGQYEPETWTLRNAAVQGWVCSDFALCPRQLISFTFRPTAGR